MTVSESNQARPFVAWVTCSGSWLIPFASYVLAWRLLGAALLVGLARRNRSHAGGVTRV